MSRLPVEGDIFGRYRLLRQLGEGGMGVVFAARDEVLNRQVAIKIVLPRHAADPEFRSRFAREAETQARLESPHVVRIYDYGDQDGVLFLCTQYVDGGDLASRVTATGALAPALAVDVVSQVLAGLEEAHQAGVVHRDVKPGNVLLREKGDGFQAYLCDFGIATMAGQGVTRTGHVVGSLAWMAPERHFGKEAGPVGDVYSAGCLFWYALTGQAPFVGSDGEVMIGHIEGPLPEFAGRTPFAKRANAVLAKALAKDPDQRYQTAGEMAADFRGLGAIAPAQVTMEDATIVRSAVKAVNPGGPGSLETVRRGAVAMDGVTAARRVPTKSVTGPRAVVTPVRTGRFRWAGPLIACAGVLVLVAGGFGVRAVVQDGPSWVQSAAETPVNEPPTIVAATPTLWPRAVARRTAGPDGTWVFQEDSGLAPGPVGSAPTDVGLGLPPAGAAPLDTGSAGGSAQGAQGGNVESPVREPASEPAPAPSTAAARRYTYRCWDSASHLTDNLATCGLPRGTVGAEWMQSAFSSSCPLVGVASSVVVEAYRCTYSSAGAFFIMRVNDASDGAAWLRQRMPKDLVDNDWSTGTVRAGTAYQGTEVINGTTRYRWGAAYAISGGSWIVYVDATSGDARTAGRNAMLGKYRHINYVRGMPCDKTTCVGNG